MIRALILALAVLLSACDDSSVRAERPDPVNAHCDPTCFDACAEDSDTGVRWTCDANDSACWDGLVDSVALPLGDKLRECDARRASCAKCITNLKTRRVIQ